MKKYRILVNCLVIALLAVAIVSSLYGLYINRIDVKNGFTRKWLQPPLAVKKEIDLQFPGYYLAGSTDSVIYLASTSAKAQLIEINTPSLGAREKFVADAKRLSINWQRSTMLVDPPNVYLTEGVGKTICSGQIADSIRMKVCNTLSEGFYFASPLSQSAAVNIYFDTVFRQRNLGSFNITGNRALANHPILQKQIDGRFCSDGQLIVKPKQNRVVFLYFYRNQFLLADTNLQKLIWLPTIDTNSTAKIQLGKVNRGRSVTFSATPQLVNKKMFVGDDAVYIISNMRSDEQDLDEYFSHTAIDRYSLKEQRYTGSYLVPNKSNKQVTDIVVSNKMLYALQGNFLVAYQVTN